MINNDKIDHPIYLKPLRKTTNKSLESGKALTGNKVWFQ
jgi:hypothetical protein